MTFNPLAPTFCVEALFAAANVAEEPVAQMPDQPILTPVINVLMHTSTLSAEEVAKHLSVAPRKLSGAIELLTGLPLGKFILEWRFLQSQELLLKTELSYSEVANRCGYADEWNLIQLYEKRLKTTPHIFRTGYRIINTNYAINRHGRKVALACEDRDAKNKVYSKKS